jgi:NosR/NirI family nitrous oxide reductase transcriptional regulator
MNFISKYFNWLQKDVPKGEVEKYPEIDANAETSVKGIFIIGDLTGIPLLKLASESGKRIIDYLKNDVEYIKQRQANKEKDVLDLIIVGAGPAGIAAGIEASKNGFNFKILEAAQKFSTIINFPKDKPIFAEPKDYRQTSDLKINDGTKESLLDELHHQILDVSLPIEENVMVDKIEKKGNYFELISKKSSYKALRIILAIGKSGNSRMLKVPGENLPKVFNRLFDPADAEKHKVLVIGGGDSALETAIATASYADSVFISYRNASFSRPKEGNVEKLKKLVEEDKIKLLFETQVKEIKEDKVILTDKNKKEFEIENSIVFTMIGKELPVSFFKRSGIKMEGELSLTAKLQFLLLILVSGVIYFGKNSAEFYKHFTGIKVESFGDVISQFINPAAWSKLVTLPVLLVSSLFSNEIRYWNVTQYLSAVVVYICFIGAVLLGIYLLYNFIKNNFKTFSLNWKTFKYAYFIIVATFFVVVFFCEKYFDYQFLGKSESFWYTGLYSLTILIFGLRRINVKPTKYIKFQTWSLILIQAIPLFILPEILLPSLAKMGVLGGKDEFIMSQVFPNETYWRSYGFILAWPLFFFNLFNSNITTFWLVFSLVQTFVFIPIIVYKWGKGAYCGWICSCGALAETLGDEYRTLAPHGAKAKKWEFFGQWALLSAFIVTGLKLISILYDFNIPIINEKVSYASGFLHIFYYVGIDIIFAGVLGVGVYFFLSGRVWCRFGCPLAALMHIYNRFSRYRIFAEKKKCISCNICTKVCHMGIDVMNYANKGIPMNDVECVRCSACVVNCPTQVLSFGSLPKMDTDNILYKTIQIDLDNKQNDWRSGL